MSTPAPWNEYNRLDWGDLIYGTAEQLRRLGLGAAVAYPGEPGGPKRQMIVNGPNGERVVIGRGRCTGEYSAQVTFRGFPSEPWGRDEGWQDLNGVGLRRRHAMLFDEYVGSESALVAAGLVPPGCFPGMPGMRKVVVTIHADGTLPDGAPTANNPRQREEGTRAVTKAGRSLYRVAVNVSESEAQQRRTADDAALARWRRLVRSLPRPPMLRPTHHPHLRLVWSAPGR